MDITKYPSNKCKKNPDGFHHFINERKNGSIWICKFCLIPKWIPVDWEDARYYATSIKAIGIKRAYERRLKANPGIVKMLEKFEKERLTKMKEEAELFEVLSKR